MNKVLVVAAHPDDELLGVGGTIMKHVDQGDISECIILGEGQTSRSDTRKETKQDIVLDLHQDAKRVANMIGFQEIYFANFPDNRFDEADLLDIVKKVEKVIKKFQPNIIYTHHGGDLNIDHQRTFQAVQTATRTLNNFCVKKLYTFETLSSTEWNFIDKEAFIPNVFIDISNYIEKKVEAMNLYKSELCNYPHPRSIEGIKILAQYRGMTVGSNYAEAFHLIREVN